MQETPRKVEKNKFIGFFPRKEHIQTSLQATVSVLYPQAHCKH